MLAQRKRLPSELVGDRWWWLGLTAEFDPESSECFIAESPRLGKGCKDLAIFEDCFGANSDVICSIGVSDVLVYSLKDEKSGLVREGCPTIYQNTEIPTGRHKTIRKWIQNRVGTSISKAHLWYTKCKQRKSTSTRVELHMLRSKPFGVCSASVLTRHGPSQEICWL